MSARTKTKPEARRSLHAVGSRLYDLEQRMNEAKELFETAYWSEGPYGKVARASDEFADAKREYEAALESATR